MKTQKEITQIEKMLKNVAKSILLGYNLSIENRNEEDYIMEEKEEKKVADKKVVTEEKKVADKKVATEEKKVVDKKATTEGKKEPKKQDTPKNTKKKFGEIKGKISKIDNKIIIGAVAAVVVMIAILVCVCVMSSDSPKKAVETMLSDLKSGNYDQEILGNAMQEESLNEEAQKLFFDKLAWKVQNVKTEGDKATVEVEITNKDFKTILGNYMQKVLKVAFSGQNIDQEEMTNYLVEELKNEDVETVTSNQSIVLEKKDGKWEATEENNDFANILLPGFNEAVSAFN